MADRPVRITFKGDSSDATSAADAVTESIRDLQRATRRTRTETTRMAGALDKVESSAKKADHGAKSAGKGLEGLKFGAQAAGGPIGEMAGRIEALGQALGMLGPVGGGMALALAGLGGFVAVSTAAAAAAVALQRGARDAIEALEPFEGTRFGPDPADVAEVERANDALDSLGTAAASVAVVFGAQFAEGTEAATVQIVALTLAARDLSGFVGELADAVDSGFGRIAAHASGLGLVVEAFEALSMATGASGYGREARELVRMQGNLREQTDASTEATKAEAAARREVTRTVREQSEAVEDLGSDLARLNSTAAQAAETLRGQANQGADEFLGGFLAGNATDADLRERAQAMQEIEIQAANEARAMITAADRQAHEEYREAQLERTQATIEAAAQAGQAVIGIGSMITGAIVANTRKEGEERRKLMKRAAAADKSLAVFGATIDAVAGVNASLATLGPPVPPNVPGIIGIATAIATGAAQVAAVAATPIPSFHVGGIVGPAPTSRGQGPGERQIVAQDGERIMTRAQQDALMTPAPTVVQLVLGNRAVDEVMTDGLSRIGSPLRTLARGRETGQERTRR